ncbi:MAG: S9 family peptidase [Acidobacteriota bacterium]|nr:S9 family peptidase [Blastocatellia bacterium]MDW8411737.1 S9 family peptidase [Acidobacteriota bacterium]
MIRVVALLAVSTVVFAQSKLLSVDEIYDPQKRVNFAGKFVQVDWLDDVSFLKRTFERGRQELVKVNAETGLSELFYDSSLLQKGLVAVGMTAEAAREIADSGRFTFNPTYTAGLINYENDLYYCEFARGSVSRLTFTAAPETNETFSPNGEFVAFVRDNNLYVAEVKTQRERALTTNGSSVLLNGRLDWIYEEEVYGRGITRAYWWSPDSTRIAFLTLDEREVPTFTVVDEIPSGQVVEVTHYPKVGDPNPKATLNIVTTIGGAVKAVDLSAYRGSEYLIVRVGWTPDSRNVVYEIQNREQSWLDLNLADAVTGSSHRLFREESTAWVDVIGLPCWLDDGTFLWVSDRTGWRHVYRYTKDGKLLTTVTSGDWDVRELLGCATDNWVYFTASEHSKISDDIYRVKLDGSSLTRLSKHEGHHKASFNPAMSMYIDAWSTVSSPPKLQLCSADGRVIRSVEDNPVSVLSEYRLGKVEFLQVKARDGFLLEAMMIQPPDFDKKKRYPVLVHVYAGPGAQKVRNAWAGSDYLWHQMLAQKGYLIWICDNRSASAKGIRSAHPIYRNLGELELRDIEDSLTWLKSQSYVDSDRIGIWGWSYGGYMAAYALTHSKSFRLGISGAPVTDWRSYDSIYTERYMGLLRDNLEGYKKSSVVEAAANLHGKLLLIHGLIDDNVHLQNTIQLIDALQRAGKQFRLMLYPQSRHGVTHPQRVKHMRQMMTEFILENL